MTRSLFITTIAWIISAAYGISADGAVKNVTADEAAKLVEQGKVTVIDIRTSDEFSEGHIKGARNIDINEPDFEKKLAELPKDKPYLVHCQGGGRSTRSLPTFEKLGFKNLYHLNEGFGDWESAGKPVEK